VDVVSDAEPVAVGGLGATGRDVALEPVLGVLDLGGTELVVVVRVNVEVSNVVPEIGHGLFASRGGSAAGIRGAHVCREETENIAHGHLKFPHLVFPLHCGDSAQVQMRPRMAGDLMAFSVHTLDGGHVGWGGVDLALVDVGASDEECSLSAILLEEIQDMVSVVLVRAVVECKGNGAGLLARVDTGSSVRNRADLSTGNRGRVGSGWRLVLGAGRAEFVLAAGRVAVITRIAAPCMISALVKYIIEVQHTSGFTAAVSRRT
jgi:hypothetical protein